MHRAAAWMVAAGVVLCACAGGGDDTSRDTSAAAPTSIDQPADTTDAAPTTVSEVQPEIDATLITVGDLLDEKGMLPLDAALQLFATLIAPLPEVEPLTLDGEVPDDLAAMAIRRMSAERESLTPAETAALDDALTVPDDVEEAVVEHDTTRARPVDLSDAPTEPPDADELQAIIDGVVGVIEANSGHDLSLPIHASVVPRSRTGGDAITDPIGSTSRPTGCRIRLPRTLFGPDTESSMSTIAHEVWHCFQLDINPTAFQTAPEWIIEGQAEWAGEEYVGGSGSSAGSWNTWLLAPQRRVTGRSYDAIGLYGVAQATGSEPWGTMPAMLGRHGTAAIETLFGGTGAAVAVREVATALVRVPSMGDEWESFGPGITGAAAAPVIAVREGESNQADLTIGPFASLPVVLAVSSGDILRVGFTGGTAGAVAMPGTGTISAAPGDSVDMCLRPEGCLCPDGSDPFGAGTLPNAGYGEGAAALGGLDGGEVSIAVRSMTLEEACTPGLVGVWTTTVAQVFAIFSAPYGGGGPACDGPFVVTFTDDGRWATSFHADCTVADTAATGDAELSGTYTSTPETFTVADIAGGGSMTIFGATQPIPIIDGYRAGMGQTVNYTIDGDQLTYSFTAPDGNTFTMTLTRAG